MKRVLCLLACIMLFAAGCASISDSESSLMLEDSSETAIDASSDVESSEPTSEMPDTRLDVNVQYIRVSSSADNTEFYAIIRSPEELDQFYENYKDEYYLGRADKVYSDTTIGFLDACDRYDSKFFDEKYLVLVCTWEPSGSIRHDVKSVTHGKDGLDIVIRHISPEVQTCDIAIWFIMIEVDKAYEVESPEAIDVDYFTTNLAKEQLRLAVDLFKASVDDGREENKNVLVSPLSVQLALAMTANGANGQTLSEIEALLGGDASLEEINGYFKNYAKSLPSDEKCKFHIANSVWFRDHEQIVLNEDFLEKCRKNYEAEVSKEPFDLSTVNKVNDWVKENTDGMIDKVLNDINDDVVMYLINALCFDAEWQSPYHETDIHDGKFTSINGVEREVSMMRSEEYGYLEDDNAKGFMKYYKGSDYAFAALLPNEGVDIYDYVSQMTADSLSKTLEGKKSSYGVANIPKFSYEYSISLNDILKGLGMPTAFDVYEADFSNAFVSARGNVYISNVLHKTFISVDERGTRAGAVTSVEFSDEAAMIPDWNLTFDRPFVYMIIDAEANQPIFIGTLMDIE
ncbi:MAG: serpin family protein [Clostridia bacterium]|nr:serpin family protein [Clostridia bacterium]